MASGGSAQEARYSASGDHAYKRWPRYRDASEGLRNYWYPVAFSKSVRRKPVPVTICGERLFLIRHKGRAHALNDRCLHRGVPLSMGKCWFPGTISCAYHGWTYDLADGNLRAALVDGRDSPIVGNKSVRVRTYPVEEHGGVVFVFVGDGEPPPIEADVPEDFFQPGVKVRGWLRKRRGDWRYAVENGFDEGHSTYLHRGVVWTWIRRKPAYRVVHVEQEGDWLVRTVDDVVEQVDYPGLGRWPHGFRPWQRNVVVRGSVRLPGWVRIQWPDWTAYEVFMGTEEGAHLSFMFAVSHAKGLKAALFGLRFWLYIRWAYMWQFNRQDQQMIEQVRIPPERLFRPDKSITVWRSHCERNARGIQGSERETAVRLSDGDDPAWDDSDIVDDSDMGVAGPREALR